MTTRGVPSGRSADANTVPARIGMLSASKYALSTNRTSAVGAGARASEARAASTTVVAGGQQEKGLVQPIPTAVTPGIARARATTAEKNCLQSDSLGYLIDGR